MARNEVFSEREERIRRMRITGMHNGKTPDAVTVALLEYELAMAKLGRASEALATAFAEVAEKKAAVEAMGVDLARLDSVDSNTSRKARRQSGQPLERHIKAVS